MNPVIEGLKAELKNYSNIIAKLNNDVTYRRNVLSGKQERISGMGMSLEEAAQQLDQLLKQKELIKLQRKEVKKQVRELQFKDQSEPLDKSGTDWIQKLLEQEFGKSGNSESEQEFAKSGNSDNFDESGTDWIQKLLEQEFGKSGNSDSIETFQNLEKTSRHFAAHCIKEPCVLDWLPIPLEGFLFLLASFLAVFFVLRFFLKNKKKL